MLWSWRFHDVYINSWFQKTALLSTSKEVVVLSISLALVFQEN